MHDPMVVAHEIRRPWPQRSIWNDAKPGGRQFRVGTSPFWTLWGKGYYWPGLITIWHNEPHGRDAFEICKRNSNWRWHFNHLSVQVIPLQKLKRTLFERCIECGRGYPWGYAPVSHSWDGPRGRWFKKDRVNYHHECSNLVQLRNTCVEHEVLVKQLSAIARLASDCSEIELIEAVRAIPNDEPNQQFRIAYRLTAMLGWERDDEYRLVKK